MKTWQDLINSSAAFKQAPNFLKLLENELDQAISSLHFAELVAALEADIKAYRADEAKKAIVMELEKLTSALEASIDRSVDFFIRTIQPIELINPEEKQDTTAVVKMSSEPISVLYWLQSLNVNKEKSYQELEQALAVKETMDDNFDVRIHAAVNNLLKMTKDEFASSPRYEQYSFDLEAVTPHAKLSSYVIFEIPIRLSTSDKKFLLGVQDEIFSINTNGIKGLSATLTVENMGHLSYVKNSHSIRSEVIKIPKPLTFSDNLITFAHLYQHLNCLVRGCLEVRDHGLEFIEKQEYIEAIKAFSFVINKLQSEKLSVFFKHYRENPRDYEAYDNTLQELKIQCLEQRADIYVQLAKAQNITHEQAKIYATQALNDYQQMIESIPYPLYRPQIRAYKINNKKYDLKAVLTQAMQKKVELLSFITPSSLTHAISSPHCTHAIRTWQELINAYPMLNKASNSLRVLQSKLDQQISSTHYAKLKTALAVDIAQHNLIINTLIKNRQNEQKNKHKQAYLVARNPVIRSEKNLVKELEKLVAALEASMDKPAELFMRAFQPVFAPSDEKQEANVGVKSVAGSENELKLTEGYTLNELRKIIIRSIPVVVLADIIVQYVQPMIYWSRPMYSITQRHNQEFKQALNDKDNNKLIGAINELLTDSKNSLDSHYLTIYDQYSFDLASSCPDQNTSYVVFLIPLDFFPTILDEKFLLPMQTIEDTHRTIKHFTKIVTANNIFQIFYENLNNFTTVTVMECPVIPQSLAYFNSAYCHADLSDRLSFLEKSCFNINNYGLNLITNNQYTQAIEAFSFIINKLTVAVFASLFPEYIENAVPDNKQYEADMCRYNTLQIIKICCLEQRAQVYRQLAKTQDTFSEPARTYSTLALADYQQIVESIPHYLHEYHVADAKKLDIKNGEDYDLRTALIQAIQNKVELLTLVTQHQPVTHYPNPVGAFNRNNAETNTNNSKDCQIEAIRKTFP